ncbi:MAG: S41 family peptidase [Candidatus Peribacteraceae bacterium]
MTTSRLPHTRSLQRTRVFRHAVTILLLVTLLGGANVSGAAAAGTVQETVTRADFLRAAISQLRLKLEKTGGEDSRTYRGVQAQFLPYVRTAEKYGALHALTGSGDAVDFRRAITRGEALQVLTALAKVNPKEPLTKTFRDVTTDDEKEAAAVALERKWMRPIRATLFGFDRFLTRAEERVLLKKAMDKKGVNVLSPDKQTIRINVDAIRRELPKKEIMETVWDLLEQQYLYKDRIKPDEMGFESVEGMVNSLDDPYTVFYRPSSAQEFQTQLRGEVIGIGAQVEQKAGVLIIVAPLKGSPAEKANLQPGDEILSVNGESLAGLSYEDGVNKVRGPKGTVANLHLRRNGMELDVAVTRDVVKIEELTTAFQGDIAVVTLHQFGQTADREFRDAMKEAAAKNPRALILDLRNNPGGLMDAAGRVVSAFVPLKTAYVQIHSSNEVIEEKTREEPIFPETMRMAVLVNKGSASAAEIVAGALQDLGRATIVGEPTFGKGTVQQLLEFTDGSSLKMTIAEWKTPKGNKIDGVGVKPDIQVVADASRDAALSRALDLLR